MLSAEDLLDNVQVELRAALNQFRERSNELANRDKETAAAQDTSEIIERCQAAMWILFPPLSEGDVCSAEPERDVPTDAGLRNLQRSLGCRSKQRISVGA